MDSFIVLSVEGEYAGLPVRGGFGSESFDFWSMKKLGELRLTVITSAMGKKCPLTPRARPG